METIQIPQIKTIHTLLNKVGLMEEKRSLIDHFTEGRTSSTKGMSRTEAKDMIDHLREVDPTKDARKKMINKVISYAHELGWRLPNGKINMDKLNAWCIKYGHQHKKLDYYQYNELPTLVSQFEKMYKEAITTL